MSAVRRPIRHLQCLPALVLVATTTLAGPAAASIPASDGTITTCYSAGTTSSGGVALLNIKDTATGGCPLGLTTLIFNRTGPKGPPGANGHGARGPAGPRGPAGRRGPRGPAGTGVLPVFETGGNRGNPARVGPGFVSAAGTITDMRLRVPAGIYAVNAIGVVQNWDLNSCILSCSLFSPSPQFAVCSLRYGSSPGNATGAYVPPGPNSALDGTASIPDQGRHTFSKPGVIELICSGFNIAMINNSSIQAIQVAPARRPHT